MKPIVFSMMGFLAMLLSGGIAEIQAQACLYGVPCADERQKIIEHSVRAAIDAGISPAAEERIGMVIAEQADSIPERFVRFRFYGNPGTVLAGMSPANEGADTLVILVGTSFRDLPEELRMEDFDAALVTAVSTLLTPAALLNDSAFNRTRAERLRWFTAQFGDLAATLAYQRDDALTISCYHRFCDEHDDPNGVTAAAQVLIQEYLMFVSHLTSTPVVDREMGENIRHNLYPEIEASLP